MTPLAAQHDVLLLDLDGVVYKGKEAVINAVPALLAAAQKFGVTLAYVTNNASRNPEDIAAQLRGYGLPCQTSDVVTSAQAAARLLAQQFQPGDKILVVGGPGLRHAVAQRGFTVVDTAASQPVAVVQGYSPEVGWRQLAEAAYAIEASAAYFATNTDMTLPTAQGIAPGNGTLVSAVVQATGVQPLVAGKPYAPLMQESIERTGAQRPLVIGDRLDTDIAGAHSVNIPSLLVLTGVSSLADAHNATPDQRPTYVGPDLRALVQPELLLS